MTNEQTLSAPFRKKSLGGVSVLDTLIRQFIIDNVNTQRITRQKLSLIKDCFLPFIFKCRFKIDYEDDVFIPSKEMQKYVYNYQPFRDACFRMKINCSRNNSNNYRRPGDNKCNSIIGFTQPFYDLAIQCAKLALVNKTNRRTINITTMVSKQAKKDNDTNHLDTYNLYPGSPIMNPQNYTTSENTHRFYCWASGLPRSVVKELYEGCWDIDIIQCYPNIFYKHFGKVHPWLPTIIHNREEWYQHLINEKCFTYEILYNNKMTDRDKAKAMTNRLFHPDIANRKPLKKTGLQLYDDLADCIYDAIAQSDIKTAHLFFSEVEAGLMRLAYDIIGHDRVLVDAHDGMRVNVSDEEVDDIIEKLYEATGFKWTAKKF